MTSEKLNLRIEKSLKDKLRVLAKKDKRNLSNFVIVQLEKVVESMSAKK